MDLYPFPTMQPILSDIVAYSGTLEQATSIGQSLMAESEDQEKSKIEARLSSMAKHFSRLRENSQKRMSRVEEALKMATKYEEQSGGFDKWLRGAEGRKSGMGPFTIASQPLKTQLEKLKVRTPTLVLPVQNDLGASGTYQCAHSYYELHHLK